MMQTYKHTQIGWLIIIAVGVGFGGAIGGILLAGGPMDMLAFFVVVLILAEALSGWMTIEVRDGQLRWRLGIGLLGGSAPLAEIEEVEIVRNPWYYGWGMHLTPDGWLYNVSGTEGIRVKLASGKKFRLGTDEPQKLLNVIREAQAAK